MVLPDTLRFLFVNVYRQFNLFSSQSVCKLLHIFILRTTLYSTQFLQSSHYVHKLSSFYNCSF